MEKIPQFQFFKHEEMSKDLNKDVFCARCRWLGLTAYGDSQDEANSKLVRMFNSQMLVNFKYKDEQINCKGI